MDLLQRQRKQRSLIYPNPAGPFTEELIHGLWPVTSPQTNLVLWDVAVTPATLELRRSDSPTRKGD